MLRFLLLILISLPGFTYAQNTLAYPSGTVDGLTILEGANQLMSGARADNVQPTADGKGVELTEGAVAGSLTIPAVSGRFLFNEAIPSWNGWVPRNEGGFRIWMTPLMADRSPSSWFDAGTWGKVNDDITTRVIPFVGGLYNIDTVLLQKLAQGVSVRIDLVRARPDSPSPKFYLFALSYTNSTGNQQLARQFANPTGRQPQSVKLDVPYRSQVVENSRIIGRICSPCSVAMSLAHFGINRNTQTLANTLYDPPSDAFGVWHRSVQGGSQEGLRGYITRFRNWSDVSDALRNGWVVSASIRFKAGEVEDPMVKHGRRKKGTEGHLILITGINNDGTVTVHDTASKDYGVHSVWKQEELAKAWFDKGGVAYVFTGVRR